MDRRASSKEFRGHILDTSIKRAPVISRSPLKNMVELERDRIPDLMTASFLLMNSHLFGTTPKNFRIPAKISNSP
jgi:hypothetical protein